MRLLVVLTVLTLALAGCLSDVPEGEAPVEGATANITIDEARPDPTFGEVTLTPAAADQNATLDAAPKWVPGEWWKYHFTSPLTGVDVEFIKVVGAIDGDTYVVGMPHEGWYKEAVVYHTPCFGDVDAGNLGCQAHNLPFQPLKFPLTEGAEWVTQFERPPNLKASVKLLSPTEAEILLTNPNGDVVIREVYDATIHEVRTFEQATAVYEVVEHGYGFEGWITIPRAEQLIFEHGRFVAPVLHLNAQPGTPTESVEVAGGYNRMSFILAVGNALGVDQGGAYRETATAPDGTVYTLESIPGGPLKIEFFEHKDPDGVWDLEHLAAGPGMAFIEGIAYHQYDIELPSGNIRSDHSHEVIR